MALIKVAICFSYVQCPSHLWELELLLAKAARTWRECASDESAPSLCLRSGSIERHNYLLLGLLWDSGVPSVCVQPVSHTVGLHEPSGILHIKLTFSSKDNPGDVWRQPLEVSWILLHLPSALLPGFLTQAKCAHTPPQTWLEFLPLPVALPWMCFPLGCDYTVCGLPRARWSGGLHDPCCECFLTGFTFWLCFSLAVILGKLWQFPVL